MKTVGEEKTETMRGKERRSDGRKLRKECMSQDLFCPSIGVPFNPGRRRLRGKGWPRRGTMFNYVLPALASN